MRSDQTLYALDRATRAIAGELDLERVLQQIVDSVRSLIQTRYAALGIIGPDGMLERFITSGIAPALRARIGALPLGHGLLGTIIRDGVSLRIPDIAHHADSYGFPASHPPMHSFLGVPIRVGGQTIGNFYLTEKLGAKVFSAKDQEVVEMFALHAGIAIQNAHLHQEVTKLAIVDERLRISRDLHDGIIQSIYGVSLSLEEVLELVGTNDPEAVARVDRAIDRLHTTIGDIRQFIVALGPLGEQGIAATVEATARELLAGSPTELTVDLSGATAIDVRMTPEAGHELVQIAREALSNVARHSRARNATLQIVLDGDTAEMRIEDDGAGFDPARQLGGTHFGLANLRDRAAAVGGSLTIDSEPGTGTRILVRLPVAASETATETAE